MRRTLARGSLLLAVATAAGLLMVTPSGAATPQTTCKTLNGTVTLTPGLGLTPQAQKASAKGTLGTCTPKAKTGGSGVITATLKLPANSSCAGLATGKQTLKATAKIVWKNKATSNVTFNAVTGSGSQATVATITGKVTKGLFANRPITSAFKVTQKAGENCTPGHPIAHLTFKQTKPWVIK
jgi:hypothetical protein